MRGRESRVLGHRLTLGSDSDANLRYQARVKALLGVSELAHYPFYTGPNDVSGNGKNGTANGSVTYGGEGVGMSPAVAGYVALPQTLMDANLGEFYVGGFVNLTAGAWNDGVSRYMFYLAGADANNRAYIAKLSTDGRLAYTYIAGGVNKTDYSGPVKHVQRIHLGISVSLSNNRMKFYINGIPSFAVTGVGTFAGTTSYLRAGNNAGTNWINNLHDLIFVNREPTDAEARIAASYEHTITRLYAFDGDSRSHEKSWMQTVYGANLKPAYGMVGIGEFGISGQGWASMIANAAVNIDSKMIPGGYNVLTVFAGVNDSGQTAQQIHDSAKTYCLARKSAGWNKVHICTEIDAQDAGRNANGWHAKYLDLNTLLRADYTDFADGIIDFGNDARLQNALDGNFFAADLVHPNEAGNDVMAGIAGPIIAA